MHLTLKSAVALEKLGYFLSHQEQILGYFQIHQEQQVTILVYQPALEN